MMFASYACAKDNSDPSKSKGEAEQVPGEIEFWTTYATEKILRDRTDLYDGVKLGETVEADACKGEYESAQVIMTAKKRVAEYKAEIVGDLMSETGETFSKSNVELRAQKYVEVRTVYSTYNSPPTGWYPDALLPLDKTVEYKENHIEAGENQGLYITFFVPTTQAEGVYSGQLKITYDGQVKTLPVKLTVHDITISEQTRSMSYFNLGFGMYLGELDSSQAMWRKYCEAILGYRISPSRVLGSVDSSDECMAAYVDEAYDLVKKYGMTTINSPWNKGDDLTRFLVHLAKKSVEENVDLIDMTIVKGPDEPTPSNIGTVKDHAALFNSGVQNAIEQFDSLIPLGASADFVAKLKSSAEAIPCIITLGYQRSATTDAADVDTYCPQWHNYDTEQGRALYNDQWKGRWWYGCVHPRPPFPTYHTEDTLVSARSVGWMMNEYDVIGNLYWSASCYYRYNDSSSQPIEDIYNGSAEHYLNCNGDGYLFYPGAPYGIDGPVSTVRLEAIRDGNEEFEMLYDLKAAYENAGKDFSSVQRYVSDLIYYGTHVRFDNISAQFATARKAMIQLALLANKGVFICDVSDDQKGTITLNVFAGEGVTVKSGGETLVGTAEGGTVKYTLSIKMENASNAIALRAEVDGTEYAFDFDLGGKVEYFGADKLLDANNTFSDGNATVNAEADGDMIRLEVGAVSAKHQSVRYTSSVLSSIDQSAKKLILYIENDCGEEIPFRWLVRLEKGTLNTEMYSGTLKVGENAIEIDLSFIDFERSGKITYSDLFFSLSSGNYGARTLKIGGITVYAN